MILTIARHELHRHLSGIGYWLLAAAAQLLLAWLLFAQLEVFNTIAPSLAAAASQLDVHDLVVAPTLSSTLLLVLIAAPWLTMQSLAGEIRAGRMPLWLGAPISSHRIIAGKLLGNWLALCLLLAGPGLALGSLAFGTTLDVAGLLTGLFGLTLAAFTFCAIGILFSGLTRQPALAFAAALGVGLFLWLLDTLMGEAQTIWIALTPHFTPLQSGLLRSDDLVYFLLLGGAAAWLASFRLAVRRDEF